jgi:hypothetical protein
MTTRTLTVELSDEEISILRRIADQDGTTPNAALKKAILQAGYLLQTAEEGNDLFVGKLDRGQITRNSDIKSVNWGQVRVQRRPRRGVQRPIYRPVYVMSHERTEES